LVSGGYPGDFERGKIISGMADLSGTNLMVFQAGIKEVNGQLLTNGGRVAAVTSMGYSVQDAVASALESIDSISFEGMNFRKDIGYEFMN
jgi:phosphoribosylamine--glycine ligase